jgi:hypothetical protein
VEAADAAEVDAGAGAEGVGVLLATTAADALDAASWELADATPDVVAGTGVTVAEFAEGPADWDADDATGTTTLTPVVESATFVAPELSTDSALVAIEESCDAAFESAEETITPGAVPAMVTATVTAVSPENAGSVTDVM